MTAREMSLASRIRTVTGICAPIVHELSMSQTKTLQTWHAIMEDASVPIRQTRMVYTVNMAVRRRSNDSSASSRARVRLAWNSPQDGMRRPTGKRVTSNLRWGAPQSWESVILQGPHLYVATPMYKSVNPTMRSKGDWSATDLEDCPRTPFPLPPTSQRETGIYTIGEL